MIHEGQKDIVDNSPPGGHGGDPFKISNALNAVQTVTVWVADGNGGYHDRKLIKAIKVEYQDGTAREHGTKLGNSHSFKFDNDERVKSMSIWTGDRVDRIRWETNQNRVFDQGGKDYTHGRGGREHSEELGNGILLGFRGSTGDQELVSLGASFKEDSD